MKIKHSSQFHISCHQPGRLVGVMSFFGVDDMFFFVQLVSQGTDSKVHCLVTSGNGLDKNASSGDGFLFDGSKDSAVGFNNNWLVVCCGGTWNHGWLLVLAVVHVSPICLYGWSFTTPR